MYAKHFYTAICHEIVGRDIAGLKLSKAVQTLIWTVRCDVECNWNITCLVSQHRVSPGARPGTIEGPTPALRTLTLTVQPNLQMVSGAGSHMLASLTSRKTVKQIFISKYLCKEAEFRLRHPPLTSVNLLLIETISRKHAVNLKNALYWVYFLFCTGMPAADGFCWHFAENWETFVKTRCIFPKSNESFVCEARDRCCNCNF